MHLSNVVVTLVDSKGKPFRELASTRTQVRAGRMCDVNLPFDTEYGFLVKNSNSERVKLEIDIDGTCVTGGGLILSAHSSEIIERFVDSARRFKFVRASNAAVADPTSEDNGSVVVRVTREYQIPAIRNEPIYHVRSTPWSSQPKHYGNNILRSSSLGPLGEQVIGSQGLIGGSVSSGGTPTLMLNAMTCSAESISYAAPYSGDFSVSAGFVEEKGATVEGSRSKQVFGTTMWAGNLPGSTVEFVFNLRCRTVAEDAEYQEYLRLQRKFA